MTNDTMTTPIPASITTPDWVHSSCTDRSGNLFVIELDAAEEWFHHVFARLLDFAGAWGVPMPIASPARDHHPPVSVVGLPTLRIGEEDALREVHHDAF